MTDAPVFTAAFAAAVLIYWLIPGRMRRFFLLLCSVVFIGRLNTVYAVYYLVITLAVYIAGLSIKDDPGRNRGLFLTGVTLLAANLIFYKYFNAAAGAFSLTGLPEIALPLGLSYVTFRLIHYLVELDRGKIPPSGFTDFALYVLFFPTFLAGPVDRFPGFHSQTVSRGRIEIKRMNYGLWRILLGIFKKFVIADMLFQVINPVMLSPESHPRVILLGSFYLAAVWLYMDLSGYTDMAIGVSRLFGYDIMENFNRPFFQKNIALFWRSWHISIYSWIRDYFFLPFFVYKGTRAKLYIGTFCAILIFMLWHRASPGFFVAGVYHGTGLCVWNLFQEAKRKWPGLRRWTERKFLGPVAIFATFNFAALGVAIPFFSRDFAHIKAILLKLLGL